MDIKQLIILRVDEAINKNIEQGVFQCAKELLPSIALEVPPQRQLGDFATNFAMQASKVVKKPPRFIAERIITCLDDGLIERVEVAGPGFMNFFLKPECYFSLLKEILTNGDEFCKIDFGKGKCVQVEFVSANPTGPLHVGHGRGAVFGSVLANILHSSGFMVEKEFYVNNAGRQVENLTLSVNARYMSLCGIETEMPEDGYYGADIFETAENAKNEFGDSLLEVSEEKRILTLREFAIENKLNIIKEDLGNFGVSIDYWFKESELHRLKKLDEVCAKLKNNGNAYEKDGALWLAASRFGDDKDRVLIRDNGLPTYITADIAYHVNKFDRGFDNMINILGADHHGYVLRMKAALSALGYDPDKLQIILLQMVHLYRNGQIFKMSKRSGESITLAELIDEVGVDAARYFFVMRSGDSQLDFDIDLAIAESNENPVYYIQYAYARISSVFRQAYENGIKDQDFLTLDIARLALLNEESEWELIYCLNNFKDKLKLAATEKAPHVMARYAYELASVFHSFYNQCRVLGVEEDVQNARLALIKATQIVLRNVLQILGIRAREKM